MVEGLIDLHVHTTASDGTLTPGELVRYAKERKLAAVAITDHDTVEGLPEAMAVAEKEKLELVPGVEISVDSVAGEMHILGYYIDIGDKTLTDALAELRRYREERNPRMVSRLRNLGIEITMEEVLERAGGSVVGRPHFAGVMVDKGYVSSVSEAFEKYLGAGKPAYVKKEKLTPEEGIKLIRGAGGIPVLAHPKYLETESPMLFRNILGHLREAGLLGMEVYYSTHTSDEVRTYLALAQEMGLLVTGGTDFHGANKPDLEIGVGQGALRIPYNLLVELKEEWQRQMLVGKP